MEKYIELGNVRDLYVKVIKNNQEEIYEGEVEEAPEEIKKLKYSKMTRDNNGVINFFVYD